MPQHATPRRSAAFVVAFILGALVLGLLVGKRYRQTTAPTPPVQVPDATGRIVSLFFPTEDATGLIREGREIDSCDDTAACIRELLKELQNGPLGDFSPAFPDAVPLPAVQVLGDLAILNLSSEIPKALEGGSSDELLTVFSLVNSVTVNFPEVTRVQLLLDGQKQETLKGHVDISEPLSADLSLEKPATPAAETATGKPPVNKGNKP